MIDLAVVGAGPAGIAAALAAADQGLSVTVIDEQQRPGGQIFRQPPRAFAGSTASFPAGYRWGRQLLARAEAGAGIDWRFGHTAIGVLHDRENGTDELRLAVNGPDGAVALPVRRTLVATGAYDMPVALPGWTLPGVIMAGAVQGFIKSQKLLTAPRLVLAGSHPLLIVVADQLRRAGADIAEVAFARGLPTLREGFGSLGAVPGHLGLFAETGVAVARLLAAGVRISTRTIVTAAHGAERVESVELSKVDAQWQPVGARRRIETDSLVLGYGFQPSTELARQAGCAMTWDSAKGGWVVQHDQQRTTAPGIWVAGEPTGVAGAEQSRAEGELAGLRIAADLGRAVPASGIAAAQRAVRRAERFSVVVQRLFEPQRQGLLALATPETIVCRCELVTRAGLERTLQANPQLSSASALKLEARSGMGPCQGRYCESTVSSLLSLRRGRPVAQLGCFSAHLPVKPVPVASLRTLND